MKRILILGCAGCGKSTLAKKLGKMYDLEVLHLDTIYWKAGWIEEDPKVFKKLQEEFLPKPSWVIDGNYRETLDLRLNYCDTVIYLDYRRSVAIRGIFKRYFQYKNKERDSIANGCPEKIDRSFFMWVWHFNKKAKPLIMEKINKCENVDVYVFKNRRSLNKFINNLNSHK